MYHAAVATVLCWMHDECVRAVRFENGWFDPSEFLANPEAALRFLDSLDLPGKMEIMTYLN